MEQYFDSISYEKVLIDWLIDWLVC
jgi:hypothetical protein